MAELSDSNGSGTSTGRIDLRPGAWKLSQTPDNRFYYYHFETHEAKWELCQEEIDVLCEELEKHFDDRAGKYI